MARFISINEILHRGRFAEKKERDSKSPIVTDAPVKEEAKPVEIVETPEDVEPIQDTPAADVVEVITDTNTEEANVVESAPSVEEESTPKKKGGKKTKVAEENN